MHHLARIKTWAFIVAATIFLTLTWATTVLAADADTDSGDGDEVSAISVLVLVGVLGAIGWLAYRRRSTRSH